MQQQEKSDGLTWKQHFNLLHWICLAHQRALVVPMRNQWGKEALGTPSFFALALMFLWTLFSRDNFMWLWMGFWVLCLIKRRLETMQLLGAGQKIHSQYDGWPFDAVRIGKTEKNAKLFVEPILCGILGALLFVIYDEYKLPVHGLPYFLLGGLFTLPFIESVKQTIWAKRLESMTDARIEQEQLMKDHQDKYGDS